ncbi:hypothetical protein [Hoylesella nanceiensis]|uniref:hypothetical protein n=1 Tax=Hoylesella nanceiensis TaxID=425941 RepID=UPI00242AFBEE|nr:hypothetical protein [Hoylesella nanceiensis]
MDQYRELATLIKQASSQGGRVTILQGIVKEVSGITCTVEIGSLTVSDVRLRASEKQEETQILITPAIGSAVILASLSGDMTNLVVVAVDVAESITINGGKLGGLINIEALTSKLNELVQVFNSHTHTAPNGPTTPPTTSANQLQRKDYEDEKIKH